MRGHSEATVNENVDDPRGMILPGKTFWVEGSIAEAFGMNIIAALNQGNWAARHYMDRAEQNGLPTDNAYDLYYGKIDGLGHILHKSEFSYAE